MLNLLMGELESTKSAPKLRNVCVSKGWKMQRKDVALSCTGVKGVVQVAVATETMA